MPRGNEVDRYIEALDHPQKDAVVALRRLILEAEAGVVEGIKWNAPSFRHGGEDRVTMNLRAEDHVKLIFHRGAKKRDDAGAFAIEDPTGLMEWAAADRAIVELRGADDVAAKAAAVTHLVRSWIAATAADPQAPA